LLYLCLEINKIVQNLLILVCNSGIPLQRTGLMMSQIVVCHNKRQSIFYGQYLEHFSFKRIVQNWQILLDNIGLPPQWIGLKKSHIVVSHSLILLTGSILNFFVF